MRDINPKTAVPRREGQKTHSRERNVKEAETGMVHLQAKEHDGLPGATRS